jgi:16S rRNA (adenine1518-N6/adenine1519-N6)-dimethyltransferase
VTAAFRLIEMAKKSLGQHFLHNPVILRNIVGAAELEPEDLVVEIGPGPGELTRIIAEQVKKVIAIELDETLYENLKPKLSKYSNIELIQGDALEYPFKTLPEFKVVANIPYYITTPIIFRLLEAKETLKSITLTVQKEVAERIVAEPGGKDYGVLTIAVRYHASASLMMIIPKEAFRPAPKVDSAVVHLTILKCPPVIVNDEAFFFKVARTAFSQRRKMLSNSLKGMRQDVAEWLEKAGIDPRRRPETLSMEEFARLANAD